MKNVVESVVQTNMPLSNVGDPRTRLKSTCECLLPVARCPGAVPSSVAGNSKLMSTYSNMAKTVR